MSFVIQFGNQLQNYNRPKLNLNQIRNLAVTTGFVDTTFPEQFNHIAFSFAKILDLIGDYKVILKLCLEDQFLKLVSVLIKGNSSIIIQDRKQKLIYTRFVPKFYSKNGMVTLLSHHGELITKKMIQIPKTQISQIEEMSKFNFSKLKNEIKGFVEQSSQFYKKKNELNTQNETSILRKYPQIKKFMQQFLLANLLNLQKQSFCMQVYKQKYVKQRFQNSFIKKTRLKIFAYLHQSDQRSVSLKDNQGLSKKSINLQRIYSQILTSYDSTITDQHVRDRKNPYNLIDSNQKNSHQTIQMYRKTFLHNLQINFCKKDSSLKEQIYNEIQIKNVQNVAWQNFQATPSSNLKIAKIKYINKTMQQKQLSNFISGFKKHISPYDPQILSATVVLKHESIKIDQKRQNNKRNGHLKWQKVIIKDNFKNDCCAFLPKFYFTDQNLSNNSLRANISQNILIQYVRKGTLRSWLNQNGQINSIYSKINIVLYIMYGLTFIHSKKIFHMDLKPMNILMDKNLAAKITDFGSAYNKYVYEKMRKQKINYFLSFSIPYTAPQIFMRSKRPCLNSKCDIYSLGLIIYQILFNQLFFKQDNQKLSQIYQRIGNILQKEDKSKGNTDQIFDKQQHLLENIYFCPQRMQFDKSQIYTSFLNLIFRCLSCYQEKRPYLGFLIIAIKEIYHSCLQYYTW